MNEQSNKNNQFWGIKHLPNAITCLNLFSGSVGVWFAFNGNFIGAAIAILASAVFDFLDGLVARLTHSYSAIGKELDSLADVISFGLVPGAMVFSMLMVDGLQNYTFLAFLLPVFSALRLAKFNIDTRQTSSFIGLPVPANALLWAGLTLSCSSWLSSNYWVLLFLTAFSSYLLVSNLPMFALKFKNLQWRDNKSQFIFLIVALIIIVLFRTDALAPIIIWYILLSTILFVLQKPNQTSMDKNSEVEK